MKVARSELIFATPTLAKMAVNAAKIAERTAHNCQVENTVKFTNLRSRRRHRAFHAIVWRGQDGTVRRSSPHQPGSIPLALSTGMASGEVINLIRSRAACWFGDLAETAAVNTM